MRAADTVIGVSTAERSRLHERLDELAAISTSDRGVTRESFTPGYERAADLVEGWMRDAGLQTRRDAAGNRFGRLPGAQPDRPCVLTGSHLDSTLEAGRLDGVYGVLGALAAAEALAAEDPLPRPVEVLAMVGEEPRFSTGCLGSRALVGAIGADDARRLKDRDGISMAEAMASVGLDPERLPEAALPAGHAALFVELHIEQGAVLERLGRRIGIVEAIAAPHDLRLTFHGQARHAGTTPMDDRHDALLAAAETVMAAERAALGTGSPRTVATVGALQVRPGANNVIPGEVELEVDVRDTDLRPRQAAVDAVLEAARQAADRRGVTLDVATVAEDAPVGCAPAVTEAAQAACDELGVQPHYMASGAYHDAVLLAARFPVGMVFVPSRDGLSHHPDEDTDAADLELGVEVLTATLRRLAAHA